MKKITFVLESFLPHHRAGTEIYVHNLIRHLQPSNYEVSVLISSTDKSRKSYQFENINVEVFHITENPSLHELNGLIPPEGFQEFEDKIHKIKPDIVHFHSFGRAINGFHLEWVKRQNIKTVFTPHLGGFFCVKGNFLLFEKELCNGKVIQSRCMHCLLNQKGIPHVFSNLAGKTVPMLPSIVKKYLPPQINLINHRKNELDRVNKYADAIIAIAPWIKNTFIINGIKENLFLIDQGIDIDTSLRKTKSKKAVKIPVKLVFASRMNPSKGFHLLREAFENIDNSNFELHVYTMKDATEPGYFEDHKLWAKSRKNVFWNENKSHSDFLKELPGMDLLVLPSISNEMAPLVILEAFAMKIPVLGSGYPAISDLINENINGKIFRNGDTNDLENKISEITYNPEIVHQWSSNIDQVRSTRDIAMEMIEIYNSI